MTVEVAVVVAVTVTVTVAAVLPRSTTRWIATSRFTT